GSQQDARTAPYGRAQRGAGPGVLCQLRLRAVRTSTRSSARTIYYYRCLGSDAWRRLGGPLCHSRPIRQDLLDRVAWTEIVKLLEEPGLIQSELDRRLEAARHTDPTKRREDGL